MCLLNLVQILYFSFYKLALDSMENFKNLRFRIPREKPYYVLYDLLTVISNVNMVSSALKNAAMPYANKVFLHCLFRSKSTAIVIMV